MRFAHLHILPGTGRGTAQRWRGRSKPVSIPRRSVRAQPDPSDTPAARHLPVRWRNYGRGNSGTESGDILRAFAPSREIEEKSGFTRSHEGAKFSFMPNATARHSARFSRAGRGLTLAFALFSCDGAIAQETKNSPTGVKQGSNKSSVKSGLDGRRAMDEIAHCIVQANPKQLSKYLGMAPSGRVYETLSGQIVPESCRYLDKRFVVSDLLLRTALFDRFYRIQFKSFEANKTIALPTIDYWRGAEVSTLAQTHAAALQFADCVIRADPHLSHELLSTEIDTASETIAFKKVIPLLGPCLTSGAKFEISKSILRGFIAESLYKIRTAAAETKSAGGQK